MAGLDTLKRHDVALNVLTTIHRANANYPLRVYRFLRDQPGARYLQFIPIVERDNDSGNQEGEALTERSVTGRQYGHFMNAIYDERVRLAVGRVYVQLFDVTLAEHVGEGARLCIFQETRGDALAPEHNGDVYSCNPYVQPNHLLGNLQELPLIDMVASPKQCAFGRAKRSTLPEECRARDVRWLRNGGCPKNHVHHTRDSETGFNALCEGYYSFFQHRGPTMESMATQLRRAAAPANVMGWVAHDTRTQRRSKHSVGRNDPCPRGSGKKYQYCCRAGD